MNVQVYAAGLLVYDSRLPVEAGYNVLSVRISERINKGGTATICLPKKHPLINGFPAFRVPVEIYRDGQLRWRGRPLSTSDDFYCRRTISCEGELCFLQDAVHRPYLYQASPEEIFRQVIEVYNAAVEEWKQFAVGTVTVTDPNDYIRLESQSPEKVFDVVAKLIDRCGGYVFFSSTPDGGREINWFADMPYLCNQPVRYDQNLIDCSIQSDVSNFATRIIPYGAFDEDGKRITLDVDGKDYVENAEAVNLRGVIEAYAIYEDITLPENLLERATRDVMKTGLIPQIIKLSAIDLSRKNRSLDAFRVGQRVPAISDPHGLSGLYDITELTEDLVDPSDGSITLSRETASLSGSDGRNLTGAIAAGSKAQNLALQKATQEIREDYQKDVARQIQTLEQTLATSIVQTTQSIILSALEEYATTNDLEQFRQTVSSQLAILSDEVSVTISRVSERVEEVDGARKVIAETLSKYFRFTDTGLIIGLDGNELCLNLDYNIVQFLRSSLPQLWMDERGVHCDEIHVSAIYLGSSAAITTDADGVVTGRSVTE